MKLIESIKATLNDRYYHGVWGSFIILLIGQYFADFKLDLFYVLSSIPFFIIFDYIIGVVLKIEKPLLQNNNKIDLSSMSEVDLLVLENKIVHELEAKK